MKYLSVLFLSLLFLTAGSVLADEPRTPSELPLEAFAQLPRMQDAELSPDGTYIAYFFPVDGRNHIVMQPLAGGDERRVVPPAGDLDFEWLHWANDQRLVFSASFFGKRFNTETTETRLASIRRDGTDLQWIVKSAESDAVSGSRLSTTPDIPPQIQDDVISWLPDEPDHILVALDENFDGKDEVRRININNGDYTNVRGGIRGVQNWMVDADNEIRLGYGYFKSEFVLKFLNGDQEWISGTSTDWWDQGWHPVAFTDDPLVTYAIGPSDTGRDVVRKLNIETGERLELVFDNGEYDVDGVALDSRTLRPIGVKHTRHDTRIKYFDSEYDKLQRTAEKAFKGMNVRLLSLAADKRQLLVRVSSDTDPGVLYYWDRDAKSMDVISESMPGLVPELLSPVEPVSYKARDGYEVPGYLTLPVGGDAKNVPMIVMPHGGPASRTDESFWFLSQFLASRGYAVFQPNFRGSIGYGDAHYRAGKKQWGGLMQDDVTDGAKWLVESGIADPERMCIVGWSYGGYSAAMGAVKTPDLFKCAVSINGVLDLPRMVNDDRKYIGGQSWVQDFALEGAKLNTISPYHQAENIQIPLLLIQADDDVRVHKEQAARMANRLQKLKKPVEHVTIELGGHSMDNSAARERILESLEAFLNDHTGR